MAGAIDACITLPLDTVKTQMQLRPFTGPVACARHIIAADGTAGLYFGFRPFLVQATGKAAVRFFLFDHLERLVDARGGDRQSAPASWSMVCGLGAGMGEALLWTAPTERLKVLKQASAGAGTGGASLGLVKLLREQGLGGVYVGAGATAARQATSTAVRFSVLDKLKAHICGSLGYEKREAPSWVTFISGGIGGAVSVVLNNPIDVVKSRLQSGRFQGGIVACMRQIVAREGPLALGAGLSARVPRLVLSTGLQFTIVAKVLTLL